METTTARIKCLVALLIPLLIGAAILWQADLSRCAKIHAAIRAEAALALDLADRVTANLAK